MEYEDLNYPKSVDRRARDWISTVCTYIQVWCPQFVLEHPGLRLLLGLPLELHGILLRPRHQVLPTPTLMVNVEVRPWSSMILPPVVCFNRNIGVALQRATKRVNAAVYMLDI